MRSIEKVLCRSALVAGLAFAASGAAAETLFWSTQAQPIEETQAMREQVLEGFEGEVDYQAYEPGPWLTRLQAELQAGEGTIGLLGALHGDFAAVPEDLVDLGALGVATENVQSSFMELVVSLGVV